LEYAEFFDSEVLIPPRGKHYRRDRHCDDVIIFPADQKEPLKAMDLVVKGMLILQVILLFINNSSSTRIAFGIFSIY